MEERKSKHGELIIDRDLALEGHFRSSQIQPQVLNTSQEEQSISTYQTETAKVEQFKLAQQGSSEMATQMLFSKRDEIQNNEQQQLGCGSKIITLSKRSPGKKSCKKTSRPSNLSSQSQNSLHQPLFKRPSNVAIGIVHTKTRNLQSASKMMRTDQDMMMIEDIESENILDDSAIEPQIDISSILFAKEVPNKPSINNTGSNHIDHLNRMKKIKRNPTEVNQKQNFSRNQTNSVIVQGEGSYENNGQGIDEEVNGINRHREIAEKRNEDFENIHQRLVNDKDAVMRETRFYNNVSSLRPNANSNYFGNAEMDERSNIQRKNETKVTKVRNTMKPATASTPQLGSIVSSSHRAMMPSKTPTQLYQGNKNKYISESGHKNYSPATGLGLGDFDNQFKFGGKLKSVGGFATSKASENRSRTACQNNRISDNKEESMAMKAGQMYEDGTCDQGMLSKVVSSHIYGKMAAIDNKQTYPVSNYNSHAALLMTYQNSNNIDQTPNYKKESKQVSLNLNERMIMLTAGAASQGTLPLRHNFIDKNVIKNQQEQQQQLSPTKTSHVSRTHIISTSLPIRPSTNNKTAEQSSRMRKHQIILSNPTSASHSNLNELAAGGETTQKMNFKDMMLLKDSKEDAPTQSELLNKFKVRTEDRFGTKETTPVKALPPQHQNYFKQKQSSRNHMNTNSQGGRIIQHSDSQICNSNQKSHQKNNQSVINQSMSIFQTLTAGFFGTNNPDKENNKDASIDKGDKSRDNDRDSVTSNSNMYQYMETEQEAFANKMHPTKIVEKNWVDNYKLAQLIEQQEKWLGVNVERELFGGVSRMQLDSAFAFIRCNSSTGFMSPMGASRVPPI